MSSKSITTVCIHQPGFLPWLGFFHKVQLSDVIVVYDDCQATKQSWTNRVQLYFGKERHWLTVPILFKYHLKQQIKDIKINNNVNWSSKIYKTFSLHYSKAPFYDVAMEVIDLILERKWDYLIDLNMEFITKIFSLLGITTKVHFSSQLNDAGGFGTQRLVNIVKSVGGNTYICGMGSSDYLKPDLFDKNNINIYYQVYKTFDYFQFNAQDFIEGLSIVDTIANVGLKGVMTLLERNNFLNTI